MGNKLEIDMDKKCAQCEKPGATQNGLCPDCNLKVVQNKGRKTMVKKNQATVTINVLVKLNNYDLLERSRRMALLLQEARRMEGELKFKNKATRDSIKELEAQAQDLSYELSSGEGLRAVECMVKEDEEKGVRLYIVAATGEIVKKEELPRQVDLVGAP